MTRKAAVLGLGERGALWAGALVQSGWEVTGFDPEGGAGVDQVLRETTISASVRGADWIVMCLPERVELMQKVIQRAQAEAPDHAIVAVASQEFDVEQVQSCAIVPARVVLAKSNGDGFVFDITPKTAGDVRHEAVLTLSELSAALSLKAAAGNEADVAAKSA